MLQVKINVTRRNKMPNTCEMSEDEFFEEVKALVTVKKWGDAIEMLEEKKRNPEDFSYLSYFNVYERLCKVYRETNQLGKEAATLEELIKIFHNTHFCYGEHYKRLDHLNGKE